MPRRFLVKIIWLSCVLFSVSTTAQDKASHTKIDTSQTVWMDEWHQTLSAKFNEQAQAIDGWFSDSDIPNQSAGASGKIRLGWEPRSTDLAGFDTRFRIKFALPSLKNRVDLLLSDDEDENLEDNIRTSREIDSQEQNTTLALRFFSPNFEQVSYRIGFGRKDQVFARATYRDYYKLNEKATLLYDTQAYYYNRDRWGTEAGASILYERSGKVLDRLNHRWYFSDKDNEFKWRLEAQRYTRLGPQSTWINTVYFSGYSRPNLHTEQVLISTKLRSNPLRKWLFFEVEPYVLWLKKEDFKATYGIALRFEAFYGKGNAFNF